MIFIPERMSSFLFSLSLSLFACLSILHFHSDSDPLGHDPLCLCVRRHQQQSDDKNDLPISVNAARRLREIEIDNEQTQINTNIRDSSLTLGHSVQ